MYTLTKPALLRRPSLGGLTSALLPRRPESLNLGATALRDRAVLGKGAPARALERLAIALEDRVPGTYGHCYRVGVYSAELAKGAGLSRRGVARVRRAAVVHDIGKVESPSEILNKPGPLSAAEFELVKRHSEIGAEMVRELGDEELTAIVRHHHERFDGSGYPDGLAGEEIPFGARIVAVADTFDAVTSTRPYRGARGHPEALDLLLAEAGTQLDPDLVTLFHDSYAELWEGPSR